MHGNGKGFSGKIVLRMDVSDTGLTRDATTYLESRLGKQRAQAGLGIGKEISFE